MEGSTMHGRRTAFAWLAAMAGARAARAHFAETTIVGNLSGASGRVAVTRATVDD